MKSTETFPLKLYLFTLNILHVSEFDIAVTLTSTQTTPIKNRRIDTHTRSRAHHAKVSILAHTQPHTPKIHNFQLHLFVFSQLCLSDLAFHSTKL